MATLKPRTLNVLRRTDEIDRDLKRLIARARGGDADAALRLLQLFAGAVDDTRRGRGTQTVVRERLNRYIAECFCKIMEGTDPMLALGLGRASNRPRGTHTADYPGLAAKVARLVIASPDLGSDRRYQLVADEAGVSKNTVKQAFRQCGQLAMFVTWNQLSDADRTKVLERARSARGSSRN